MANILWMDSKKCDGFSLEMYWKIHHKILCWKKKQSHIFVDICDGPEGLRDGFFLGKALANPSQNSWLRMAGILRMDLDFFLRWISLWKWIGKSITKFCAERKCTTTFLWWIPLGSITKFFANVFLMNAQNKMRLILSLELSWKIHHKLRPAGISLMGLKKLRDGLFLIDMYSRTHRKIIGWEWRAFCARTSQNLRWIFPWTCIQESITKMLTEHGAHFLWVPKICATDLSLEIKIRKSITEFFGEDGGHSAIDLGKFCDR